MSYARLADGSVRSWGGGANGELGNGALTARQTRPVTVTGLTGVVALAAGRNHGLALRSDGTVMAWGLNSSGPARQRHQDLPLHPASRSPASPARSPSPRARTTRWRCSPTDASTPGARRSRGQLGNGSTTDRTTPVQVTGLPAIAALGCGRDHVLAITATGTMWAWGQNDYGQLGDGTMTRRTRPILVPGVSDAADAAGGRGYTVLRRNPA